MRLDLDDIERKARAVRGESGYAEWFDAMGEYRAATPPPVVLALIARLQLLERTVGQAATLLEAKSDRAARLEWAKRIRVYVGEGGEPADDVVKAAGR